MTNESRYSKEVQQAAEAALITYLEDWQAWFSFETTDPKNKAWAKGLTHFPIWEIARLAQLPVDPPEPVEEPTPESDDPPTHKMSVDISRIGTSGTFRAVVEIPDTWLHTLTNDALERLFRDVQIHVRKRIGEILRGQ